MTWIDLLIVGIVAGFAILGMVKGFMYSLFKLASYFASIIVSIMCYPIVAKVLMKTAIYTNIKASILKNLLSQQSQLAETGNHAKQAAADTVINNLHLPGFFKETLISKLPDPTALFDVAKIMDMVSANMTKVVIDILSLVVLYIAIRIGLFFMKYIIKGISKLPVFKQVDKLGGFTLGGIEGLLTVYVLCAVIMLFSTSPQFKPVFEALDNSLVAKFFYQHNFVIDWMFPKGGTL